LFFLFPLASFLLFYCSAYLPETKIHYTEHLSFDLSLLQASKDMTKQQQQQTGERGSRHRSSSNKKTGKDSSQKTADVVQKDHHQHGHAVPRALDGGSLPATAAQKPSNVLPEKATVLETFQKTPNATSHYIDDSTRERLHHLQQDDKAPDVRALHPKQQRALTQRQRRPHKGTAAKLERLEVRRLQNAVVAAQASQLLETTAPGMMETESDMERTTALTQTQLKRDHLDADTARHSFQLDLSATAPYGWEYDRSGRYSVLYGQSNIGHLAIMDNHQQSLMAEWNVQERIRDATFLHNFTLLAAAQKNHVFIYDHTGAEIHRLHDHIDPFALQFLPHHWLLASIGRTGVLRYRDTSTGENISTHKTHLGPCSVLRQNPTNAVLFAGHANGCVTLWSPASSRYLAKLHCHKGAAVHAVAISPDGHTLVTGGADRQLRIWDLRMYQERHSYLTIPGIPTSLDISHTGMLAVGHAGHATFWSAQALQTKVRDPYMHHAMPGGAAPVHTIRFRPFEDVCGIGHTRGVDSVVIPGCGAAQLDTLEYHLNPAADVKQRREMEVRALLDKLAPSMIALDPTIIGGVEASNDHTQAERVRDLQTAANEKALPHKAIMKVKKKKRGQSKIATQLRRKRKNVIDQNTIKLREAREREKAATTATTEVLTTGESATPSIKESAPAALKRFF
jgi:U3 small nucleolar RNA-associated protein 7